MTSWRIGVRGHSFQELLLKLHLYTACGWPYRGGAERRLTGRTTSSSIHQGGYLCGRPQRALQATSENSNKAKFAGRIACPRRAGYPARRALRCIPQPHESVSATATRNSVATTELRLHPPTPRISPCNSLVCLPGAVSFRAAAPPQPHESVPATKLRLRPSGFPLGGASPHPEQLPLQRWEKVKPVLDSSRRREGSTWRPTHPMLERAPGPPAGTTFLMYGLALLWSWCT